MEFGPNLSAKISEPSCIPNLLESSKVKEERWILAASRLARKKCKKSLLENPPSFWLGQKIEPVFFFCRAGPLRRPPMPMKTTAAPLSQSSPDSHLSPPARSSATARPRWGRPTATSSGRRSASTGTTTPAPSTTSRSQSGSRGSRHLTEARPPGKKWARPHQDKRWRWKFVVWLLTTWI